MRNQFNDIYKQLECYFQTPVGDYLWQREQEQVMDMVRDLHGPRLLQLGTSTKQHLVAAADQPLNVYTAAHGGGDASVLSDAESLPFASESIDILVLHHALEFSGNPHQLLREANRVLAPRGHIIVVTFNPVSLFGLGLGLRRLLGRSFWACARLLGGWRLRDWLHLLGLELERTRHLLAVPPVGSGRLQTGLLRADRFFARHQWPVGGVYITHACKQHSAITPDRARWNRAMGNRLIGLGSAKPVASPFEGDVAA